MTREPAEGDEEVFGEAWPLIAEWRELRDAHPNRGGGPEWLRSEERLLVMELTLLEEHGMTLPPEKQPLRDFARNGQINWRRTALSDTRRALRKWELLLRVGRFVTFGLLASVVGHFLRHAVGGNFSARKKPPKSHQRQ